MKSKKTRIYNIIKIKDGIKEATEDEVVEESPLSIFLNHQKITSLMCTPQDQKHLGVGFLFTEGLIRGKDDISRILFNSKQNQVKVFTKIKRRIPKDFFQGETFTSGCGKRKSFQRFEDLNLLEDVMINLEFTLSADEISKLMREFELKSSVFRSTGGAHSAALANRKRILIFNEDIGRHNAVDKIIGESLIKNIPLQDKLLISSGRVSSDILLKAWRTKISLIVSRSAPTSLAVELALKLGITIVGFARGKRMNVYTYTMRVVVTSQ